MPSLIDKQNNLVIDPIFIVGPGRSGTTLLRSLLSAHSEISIAPETHFMARTEDWGGPNAPLSDFETFWQAYTTWSRFQDLAVEADRCRELIRRQGTLSFEAVFRAVLAAYREKSGKRQVGEKTPGHSRYIPHLLEWFPGARILVMIRDPRAVVASQLGTPYVQARITSPSLRSGLALGSRLSQVAFYAENWADVFENRVPPFLTDQRLLLVRYEALVQNPKKELLAICEFLGVDFESSMLTERTSRTVPMPAAEPSNAQRQQWRREHHARSRRPVFTTSLEKWKSILMDREIRLIEGRCFKLMKTNGYEATTSSAERLRGRLLLRTFPRLREAEARLRGALAVARQKGENRR